MSHHIIIHSEEEVESFFYTFLPENGFYLTAQHIAIDKYLTNSEKFYNGNIKQLRSVIMENSIDYCVDGLMFLSGPISQYRAKFEINSHKVVKYIPSHCTAIYCTVNPIKELEGGYDSTDEEYSEKPYGNIIICTKNPYLLMPIVKTISCMIDSIVTTIETKEGYNIIYNRHTCNREALNKLYNLFVPTEIENDDYSISINSKGTVITNSQVLCPIPGTYEGGFRVRTIALDILFQGILTD